MYIFVIRSIVEPQLVARVCKELCKLRRKAFTQLFYADRLLFLTNQFIFLVIAGGLDPLPRQGSLEKVNKNICKRFQVVLSR